PSWPWGTTVALREYACAVLGMLHALSGIANPRAGAPPRKNGPPNGPFGFRVSATRHGDAATKRNPGIVPVPLNPAVCGVPPASSLTLSVPVCRPVTVGVNVTLMAQLAPAAKVLPQLLLWAKSPLAVILVTVRGVVPQLVSVRV